MTCEFTRDAAGKVVQTPGGAPELDLATVEEYERSHAGRSQILSRIGDLLEPPWGQGPTPSG